MASGRFDRPAEDVTHGNAAGFSKGFRPVPAAQYGRVNTPGADRSGALNKQAANREAVADGIADAAPLNLFAQGIEGLGRIATAFDQVVQENVSQETSDRMEALEKEFFGVPTSSDEAALAGAPEGLRNDVARNDALVQASVTRSQVGGHFESRVLANMRQMQRKYPGWADVVEKHFTSRLGQNPRKAVVAEAQRAARAAASAAKAGASSDAKFKRQVIKEMMRKDLAQAGIPGLTPDNAVEVLSGLPTSQVLGAYNRQHHRANDLERLNQEYQAGKVSDDIALQRAEKHSEAIAAERNSAILAPFADPNDKNPPVQPGQEMLAEDNSNLQEVLETYQREYDELAATGDTTGLAEASHNYAMALDQHEQSLRSYYQSTYSAYNNPRNQKALDDRVRAEMQPLRRIQKTLEGEDISRLGFLLKEEAIGKASANRRLRDMSPTASSVMDIADLLPPENQAPFRNSIIQQSGKANSFQQFVNKTLGGQLADQIQGKTPVTTLNQDLNNPLIKEAAGTKMNPITGNPVDEPGKEPTAKLPLQVANISLETIKFSDDPAVIARAAKKLFSDGSLTDKVRPEYRREFFGLMTQPEVAKKMSVNPETQNMYGKYLGETFATINVLALRDFGPRANSYWETFQADFDPKTGFFVTPSESENQSVVSSTFENIPVIGERAKVYDNMQKLNADFITMRNAAVDAGLNPDTVAEYMALWDNGHLKEHPEYSERKGRGFTRLQQTVIDYFYPPEEPKEKPAKASSKIQGRLGEE